MNDPNSYACMHTTVRKKYSREHAGRQKVQHSRKNSLVHTLMHTYIHWSRVYTVHTYMHFLKKCIYTHTHIHINHTYFSFCMCMYKNTRSKKLERFLSQLVTIPHVPEMICLKAFLGIMDQVRLGRGL